MSVLQYVGARYVPKLFDDGNGGMEWRVNTYYEPLTIVTYNNASYISRTPVPANIGNPTLNGEYWALSGNYNAYVNELNQKIEDVKTSNKEYKDTASLKGRKILIIGDSWCKSLSTEFVGWGTTCATYLLSVGLVEGTDFVIRGRDGAGFSNGGYLELIKAAPKLDYTDLYIFGGANDLQASNSNIQDGASAIVAYMPDVKKHFIFTSYNQNDNGKVISYIDNFNVCAYAGFVYSHSALYWTHMRNLWINYGHLTTSGYVYIGFNAAMYIMGVRGSFYRPQITSGDNQCWYDDDFLHFKCKITIPSVKITSGNPIISLTVSEWLAKVPSYFYEIPSITWTSYCWASGGNLKGQMCFIMGNGSNVSIILQEAPPEGFSSDVTLFWSDTLPNVLC